MFQQWLNPFEFDRDFSRESMSPDQLGRKTMQFISEEEDLQYFDLALIGVPEGRGAIGNENCLRAPDEIRKALYPLFVHQGHPKIVDLGNLKPGITLQDTYIALKEVVNTNLRAGVIPIILGGGQNLTYGQYLAYENQETPVNLVVVDQRVNLTSFEENFDSESFLLKIFLHQPNYLLNFCQIGYQTYLTEPKALNTVERLAFDAVRLGALREDLKEAEPLIRDSDLLSVDLSAIRMADAPGNGKNSPNGFSGEEICQIIRYAGMSDKLTSIGFYEYNPELDNRGQTAALIAQMIWYFIEGYYARKNENPFEDSPNFYRYIVHLEEDCHDVVFLRSKKSDRWWIDVGENQTGILKYKRFIPCSYSDYKQALNNEIPDRLMRAIMKFS